MADQNVKVGVDLEVKTKSLRTQLREATMELVKLQDTAGASTDEIVKLAKKVAELKDRIGDARDTIDAFNPDAKFKAFSASIQGVTGAFSAVQGAMALFGAESEDLQKQLLKVQGALALSEGLNSVLSSVDAFKNLGLVIREQVVTAFSTLRGAILTTGLGALAIALAEGYLLWQDYAEGIEKVREKLKKLKEDTERQIRSQKESELDALERLRRKAIAEAQIKGASEDQIAKIEDMYSRLKVRAKARALGEASADDKLYDEFKKDLQEEEIAREEKKADIISKKREKNKQEEDKRNAERQRLRDEAEQKEIESQQKRIERLEEISKASRDLGLSEFDKQRNALNDQLQKDLEMFAGNAEMKSILLRENFRAMREIAQKESETMTEEQQKGFDKYIKDLEKSGEREAKAKEKTQNMIMKSMDKSIAKTQDQTKIDNMNRQIRLQNAEAIGNALGALSGMAEQGSDLQKSLALGQVAIDTAVAISSLTANSEANPANAVTFGGAGISQFATGIIRILANIAQAKSILSQAPGNGGSVSTPSISTSAPVMPQYQAPQATRLDQQSLNTISNVVARAYVVESDITGSQKRIKRIETASKF
jgi:hypothetical protein